MELTIRIENEEGVSQTVYEGAVAPGSEVTTQVITSPNAVFDKDGNRTLDKNGEPAVTQEPFGMDVLIAAPLLKEVAEERKADEKALEKAGKK